MADDRSKSGAGSAHRRRDEDDREKPLRPQGVNRVTDDFKVRCWPVLMIRNRRNAGRQSCRPSEIQFTDTGPITGNSAFRPRCHLMYGLSRSMTERW